MRQDKDKPTNIDRTLNPLKDGANDYLINFNSSNYNKDLMRMHFHLNAVNISLLSDNKLISINEVGEVSRPCLRE
jgi:hypothetical protein